MHRLSRQLTARANRRHCRGAALVVAMMALLIASMIGGVIIKTVLAEQRLVLREQDRQQSEWLADSGVQRALARLEKDPAYSGETWKPLAAEIGGHHDGAVRISVERIPDSPDRRRIVVVADYPNVEPKRCRSRKEMNIPIQPAS